MPGQRIALLCSDMHLVVKVAPSFTKATLSESRGNGHHDLPRLGKKQVSEILPGPAPQATPILSTSHQLSGACIWLAR